MVTSRPPAEVVVGSAGAAARQRRCLSRGSSGTRTAVARRQRKRTAKAVSLQREQRKHTTNIVPYSQERSGNTRTHGKASALTTNAADKHGKGNALPGTTEIGTGPLTATGRSPQSRRMASSVRSWEVFPSRCRCWERTERQCQHKERRWIPQEKAVEKIHGKAVRVWQPFSLQARSDRTSRRGPVTGSPRIFKGCVV